MLKKYYSFSSPISPPNKPRNTYAVFSQIISKCFKTMKRKRKVSILTWLLDKQDFLLVACHRPASLRDKPRTRRWRGTDLWAYCTECSSHAWRGGTRSCHRSAPDTSQIVLIKYKNWWIYLKWVKFIFVLHFETHLT